MSIQKTRKIVMMGLLTAIVFAFQFISMSIRTATFSITLSLVPIAVGAALYGKMAGAWLGFVFGAAVLATGDANVFLAVSVPGTIITVILKGMLAGFASGVAYDLLKNKNDTVATYVSGVLTPVVNTGVFILGCLIFFMPTISEWSGGNKPVKFIFVGLIGFNFFIELAVNLILSPSIAKIIKIARKEKLGS
ncbi:MAG: ECF transporter S component [Clostridia bacterium]|nr:ECF transporter S component [Clostridia bacterium]